MSAAWTQNRVQCSKDSDHVVVSFTVEAADDFECPYPQCKSREFKDDGEEDPVTAGPHWREWCHAGHSQPQKPKKLCTDCKLFLCANCVKGKIQCPECKAGEVKFKDC